MYNRTVTEVEEVKRDISTDSLKSPQERITAKKNSYA